MKNKQTLPPFLRDFHDQKTVVKGFYTWLYMRDNSYDTQGESYPNLSPRKRRVQMCDWISFQILLMSFVDFLSANGYSIYRTRGKQAPKDDIIKNCGELSMLPTIWDGIEADIEPGKFPLPKMEYCIKILKSWESWISLMPKKVQEFYERNK